MNPVEKLYDDGFFRKRARLYGWRAPVVCGAVVEAMRTVRSLEVRTACDVGCAVGDLVQGFLDLGVEAWGIEGSQAVLPHLVCPQQRVAVWDLRLPLPPQGITWRGPCEAFVTRWPRSDVVTCFEVAEHLEPEFSGTFVETLVSLSDNLVVSACPPHPTKRPTRYHPNEQLPEYWVRLFADKGYVRDEEVEKILKDLWFPFRRRYGVKAYYDNLICFAKEAI